MAMRLVTRSDFDGLVCGALLLEAGIIDTWKFAHPKDLQDGLVETPNEEEAQEFHVEDFENPEKEFYVKLNIKDDIIELYDSSSDRLVETISGDELGELVQKLNMASGIFVNKKV